MFAALTPDKYARVTASAQLPPCDPFWFRRRNWTINLCPGSRGRQVEDEHKRCSTAQRRYSSSSGLQQQATWQSSCPKDNCRGPAEQATLITDTRHLILLDYRTTESRGGSECNLKRGKQTMGSLYIRIRSMLTRILETRRWSGTWKQCSLSETL